MFSLESLKPQHVIHNGMYDDYRIPRNYKLAGNMDTSRSDEKTDGVCNYDSRKEPDSGVERQLQFNSMKSVERRKK